MSQPFHRTVLWPAVALAVVVAGSGWGMNGRAMAQEAQQPEGSAGQAAAAGQAAPSAGQRTDGQIEMDVVSALDASEALKNDLITAATIQGQVTLSGTVSSDASKQLAESIVGKVQGVTKVNNHLKVGNPADAQEQQPAQENPADDGIGDNQAGEDQAGNGQQGNAPPSYGQQPNQAPQESAPQRPVYGQNPPPQNAPQGYPQQGYPQEQGYPQGYPQQAPPPPAYGRQGYPPPPPGYGPGYPPPPGYGQQQAQGPRYSIPSQPVTVAQGTVVQVRTNDSLDNKRAKEGTPVDFTVICDVNVNGWLAIPRGATVHGVVTESKNAGELSGTPMLGLRLTSLDLGGRSYPLTTDEFRVRGPNKTAHTAGNVIGGALLGALIGGAAGGGGGAAIGAAAGGTVGTAASAAGNPRAWIPAEALVTFHLDAPVTVDPVTQQEASRLEQGLYPGGPQLYRRGYYGAYYRPGFYAYPPVYYRPYYMVGGTYYWR